MQDSSRRSNMVRHIRRLHGLGHPVKEKPSAVNGSIQNIFVDSDIHPSLSGKWPRNVLQAKDNDIVDKLYDMFSKIIVIKALSGQGGSTIFPLPGPFAVSTIDPPVGFHTFVCDNCLTAPIDPVTSSDFKIKGPIAFESNHECQQDYLEIKRRRAENGIVIDVIKVWNELKSLSTKMIADLVKQWYGPENDVSIHVVEVDDSISQKLEILASKSRSSR